MSLVRCRYPSGHLFGKSRCSFWLNVCIVLFVLYLFVSLVVSNFVFDGKTVFLIHHWFLVIANLLLYYHVRNHMALSEHPYVNL